ncbi:hypothetical protein H671_2g4719 [Cricetulus griseus]|nr:hypothetical protein H671_2g4719 [Cricetulus griseus]
MDNASDYGSEDCRFDSCLARLIGSCEEATAGNLSSGTLSPHIYLTAAEHYSRTLERQTPIPGLLEHTVLERQCLEPLPGFDLGGMTNLAS